ncbi:MAG: glycosyltransferase, partial [Flavobacteriales bacterium]|nr:glycosyltransferase [Flavobacteriales bacterium]
ADYRDEWNSRPSFEKKFNIIKIVNSQFEKKWLSNVEFFTYVNDEYLERIEQFVSKKGHVIENGYNEPIPCENEVVDLKTLSFTFLGTLYGHQEIYLTSNLLQSFQKHHPKLSLELNFIGISIQDKQVERVRKQFSWCQELMIRERLDSSEIKPIIARTDIFLMFPIQKMKGVIPTKVYDYLPYRKPILFYPNDEGRIAEVLRKTGFNLLNNSKILKEKIDISNYSREHYSKKLMNLLLTIQNAPNDNKIYSSSFQALKFEKKLIQIREESKTGLKKILIISYFAPPANFVASERISSWMKDLPKFGIYPVLLTRHWTDEQTSMDTTDVVMRYQQITGPTSQTHKIAIKKTILEKLGLTKFKYLRKTNSILVYLKLYLIPTLSFNKKFLKTAIKIIKDQNIDKVVISGTPFYSFWIGYKLKQWNSNIQWYPDYRDTWNSIPNKEKFVLIKDFFLRKIEIKKEKKWTTNANMFFTVSEDWKQSISSLIGKKGLVIMNGFDKPLDEIIPVKIPRKEKSLVITYAGTLYPSQDIFRLLDAVSELITSERMNIKVNLIGTDSIFNMKTKLLARYEKLNHAFNFSTRISKSELEIIYQSSDLLWLTSFTNIPGWYPVKLFDYASTGVPILLFPTDNGVMQEFISRTRTGFSFSDSEKLKKWIKNIYCNPQSTILDINYDELGKFQRITSIEKLAKFLNRES